MAATCLSLLFACGSSGQGAWPNRSLFLLAAYIPPGWAPCVFSGGSWLLPWPHHGWCAALPMTTYFVSLGLPGHLALRPFSLSIAWLTSYRLFGIPRPERGTMMVFYRTCNARLIVDHWMPLLFTAPPNYTPNELILALETRWPDLRETEWQAHTIPWPTLRSTANGNLRCFILVCADNGAHSIDRPQGLLCLASLGFELAVGITTSRMINILSLRETPNVLVPVEFSNGGLVCIAEWETFGARADSRGHGFLFS